MMHNAFIAERRESASEARPMIVFHSRFPYVYTDIGMSATRTATTENGQATHRVAAYERAP